MTSRPAILAPDLRVCAGLARDLEFRRQWVAWRLELRGEQWTKRPLMVSGDPASSTDAATWCHYEVAAAACGEFDGIGFVLTARDPFAAFDIDHCIEDGQLSDAAASLVAELDSYAERSPSGVGVRVLLRGQKPGSRSRMDGLELYDRDRFVTVTGARLETAPATICDRQAALTAIYLRLWPQDSIVEAEAVDPAAGEPSREEIQMLVSLMDIDPELRVLYLGKWPGRRWTSHSEADASFCYKLLAAGLQPGAVQRLLRSSALYRDKTDARRTTSTYLAQTVSRMQARVREARLG